MRTLSQGSAWLKQGVKPRTFVRIVDDTSGDEILFAGSATNLGADGQLESVGRITQHIRHEGGMAEVSGCEIRNLILEDRVPLCEEASISPTYQGAIRVAGRLYAVGYGSYTDARDATTGEYSQAMIIVGRKYSVGDDTHWIYRTVLEFSIPADLDTCEDAFIDLIGNGDFSDVNFEIQLVEGNFSGVPASGFFNDFEGWNAVDDYSVTTLNETWETTEFSAAGHNYIRGNAALRDLIVANAGGTVKLMLISERDSDFTNNSSGASGDEYVQFEAASAKLVLRYNSLRLDNQIARVYMALDPVPSTIAGMELVWTGVVDGWEINDRILNLKSKQNDFKKNIMISPEILNLDDFPNCPPENIGKPLPIIYGDFMSISHKTGVPYVANEYNSGVIYSHKGFVKAYVINEELKYFCIAKHPIKELDNMLAEYFNEVDAYGFYSGVLSAIPDTNNQQFKIDAGEDDTKFPYILTSNDIMPVIGVVPLYFLSPYMTNYGNMINEDYTDSALITPGDSQVFYLTRPGIFTGLGVLPVKRYICFYSYSVLGYDNELSLTVIKYQNGLTIDSQIETINTNGWHYIDISDDDMNNEILSYQFSFGNLAGTKSIMLRNFSLCVGVKKTIEDFAYISCKGKYDDVSGTITGSASALIENPSHVIESIARSEMSLVAAEIDTSALDIAATAITGKKFAFQLLERREAREILNDLAYQARLKLWWDEQDRLTALKFNSASHFPNSGTDIPGSLDIFSDTGAPAAGYFTENPLISGLTIRPIDVDDVISDFIIRYAQNYATGEYEKVLRVNKDEENLNDAYLSGTTGAALKTLCETAYNIIKTVNTLDIEAWAIRDEATATALMQHLIERRARRPYEIEFDAALPAVRFELGDFINVRNDLISNRFGTAVMNTKKWEITGFDPDPTTFDVHITAIEV